MAILIGYFLTTIRAKSIFYGFLVTLIAGSLISTNLISGYLTEFKDGHKNAFMRLTKPVKKIYTDPLFIDYYNLWMGFDPKIKVSSLSEIALPLDRDIFVIVNEAVLNDFKESHGYIPPDCVINPPSNWKKFYEEERRRRWKPRTQKKSRFYKIIVYHIE
jgi:hypothetical protein